MKSEGRKIKAYAPYYGNPTTRPADFYHVSGRRHGKTQAMRDWCVFYGVDYGPYSDAPYGRSRGTYTTEVTFTVSKDAFKAFEKEMNMKDTKDTKDTLEKSLQEAQDALAKVADEVEELQQYKNKLTNERDNLKDELANAHDAVEALRGARARRDAVIASVRNALQVGSGESLYDAVKRVVRERDSANNLCNADREATLSVLRDLEQIRDILGAGVNAAKRVEQAVKHGQQVSDSLAALACILKAEGRESLLDAAKRVMRDLERITEERDRARRTVETKDAYLNSVRIALDARDPELTIQAAHRVVRQRDEARLARNGLADRLAHERDAARVERDAEPRKLKVGDRIRILEFYVQGRRDHYNEGPAEVTLINNDKIYFRTARGVAGWLDAHDRWEFI